MGAFGNTFGKMMGYANMILNEFRLYVQRVMSDSGEINNSSNSLKIIKGLKTIYGDLNNVKLLWTGEMGVKKRSSGIFNFASKLYSADLLLTHNDLVQATEINQPYLYKKALQCPVGDGRSLTFPDISFTATDSYLITIIVNPDGTNNDASGYSSIFGKSSTSWGNAIMFSNPYDRINLCTTGSVRVFILPHTMYLTGKTSIIQIYVSEGQSKAFINGIVVSYSGAAPTAITLNLLMRGYRYDIDSYFKGSLYGTIIKSGIHSDNQILAEYNLLSGIYPELETTTVLNKLFASNNLTVVRGGANLIANAQVDATWITGAAGWCYHPSSNGISGKLYNKAARDIVIANPPRGYRLATEFELKTLASYGGNALKSIGSDLWNTTGGTNTLAFNADGTSSRNADGTFNTWKNTASFWCSDSDKVLLLHHDSNTAEIVPATANEGHAIRLVRTNWLATPPYPTKNINMLIGYGQSLSVQSGATSALTNFRNILSFPGGCNEFLSNVDITSPAIVESFYGSGLTLLSEITNKSWPCVAASMISWMSLLENEDNTDLSNFDKEFILSSPGQSSSPITYLNKGTTPYNRLLFSVQKAFSFSATMGKSLSVPCLFWVQGEAEFLETKIVYYNKLNQLFIDLNTDIKAITGQSADVQFITYQTSPRVGIEGITDCGPSLAQIQLCIDKENVHFGGAMYQFQYTDSLHTSDQATTGLQMGIQAKRVIEDNNPLPLFYPLSKTIVDNTLRIIFTVPVAPMRFDISGDIWHNPNGKQTNFGFTLKNSSDISIIASEPTIENGDTLVISCTESPVGAKLSYALNGHYGGGNLCDSQNIIIPNKGINYVIDNFCPAIKDYEI